MNNGRRGQMRSGRRGQGGWTFGECGGRVENAGGLLGFEHMREEMTDMQLKEALL